ncbi:MAG: glycogen synthase [Gammaproteobacteria bacterium]|nr:glycogen synthase [Gammaproteobacteria bacterium]
MPEKNSLRILMCASEFAPLAKTGGLGDVTAALSAYLHRSGHDVRVLLPFYSSIKTEGLQVYPVDFMQGIQVRLGAHQFSCDVYVTEMPRDGTPVYLLHCPALYHRAGIYTGGADEHLRFIMLNRMVFEMCQRMGWAPDILHCNDWHTALVPLYHKALFDWDKLFSTTRSLFSIHNIGYQGTVGTDAMEELGLQGKEGLLHQQDLAAGQINFMRTGILYADVVGTVSPTYAREIQTPEYGMGMEEMLRARDSSTIGILNGVDYDDWSPQADSLIPRNYGADDIEGKEVNKQVLMREMGIGYQPGVPLLGLVARLTAQKGLDLVAEVLPALLKRRNFSFVALGSGEGRYADFLSELQRKFPGRVCFYSGYNNKLAHMIEAGADMFLMPSAYEPCGLNQMYSLKYGTIPIVRKTGGLADSVQLFDPSTGNGTGIVFRDYNKEGLWWAIDAALTLYQDKNAWSKIMANAMAMDFSWDRQGAEYVRLYRAMLAARN